MGDSIPFKSRAFLHACSVFQSMHKLETAAGQLGTRMGGLETRMGNVETTVTQINEFLFDPQESLELSENCSARVQVSPAKSENDLACGTLGCESFASEELYRPRNLGG